MTVSYKDIHNNNNNDDDDDNDDDDEKGGLTATLVNFTTDRKLYIVIHLSNNFHQIIITQQLTINIITTIFLCYFLLIHG